MFTLRYSQAAIKALKKAPPDVAARIRTKLKALALDPYGVPNVKKLTGHPGFRLRVGDWRVLYLVIDQELVIHVVDAGQRKEIYR